MAVTLKQHYVGIQVTLAASATAYNILTLINTALAALTPVQEAPGACRELTIQSHDGVDGSGANTKDILVGDSAVTNSGTPRFAFVLHVGGNRTWRSSINNVDLSSIWVMSSGTSQKLNVEITVG